MNLLAAFMWVATTSTVLIYALPLIAMAWVLYRIGAWLVRVRRLWCDFPGADAAAQIRALGDAVDTAPRIHTRPGYRDTTYYQLEEQYLLPDYQPEGD